MPKIDFTKVPNMAPRKFKFEYRTIPEGWYLAELAEAKPEFDTDGTETWLCHWVILDGPHKGTAVKDWMRWGGPGERSGQNLSRCKMVCAAVSAITEKTGLVQINPENVQGGVAAVKVYHATNDKDGKIYCNVSYDGVRLPTREEFARVGGAPVAPDAEIPF